MRIYLPVIVFAALFSRATAAKSDESDGKLPQEGSWAKYHAITKDGNGEEKLATFTLKSLGKVIVDGQPCRWLESEYVASGEASR